MCWVFASDVADDIGGPIGGLTGDDVAKDDS